jgi:hypothetical protein
LPPITLEVPTGTKAVYITALSLSTHASTVSVSWDVGLATFGAEFVGPSTTHVLAEKVFGLPIVVIDDLPEKLLVSMNFNDTVAHQHSISGPVTTKVGPEGDAQQVQISGYAYNDHKHEKPMTITILFQGTLSLLPTAVAQPGA